MNIHLISFVVLMMILGSSVAIPKSINPTTGLSTHTRRQDEIDFDPNSCTDICTPDPSCEQMCDTSEETGELICDTVCTHSDATYTSSGSFCLNIPADTPENEGQQARGTTAVILRGITITAAGDITINVIDRNARSRFVVWMDGCRLFAGGDVKTNFGNDLPCLDEEGDCQVIMLQKNVHWTSLLTGNESSAVRMQLYESWLDSVGL